jgi:hypothetical protein
MFLLKILSCDAPKQRHCLLVVLEDLANELGDLVYVSEGFGLGDVVVDDIHIFIEGSSEC